MTGQDLRVLRLPPRAITALLAVYVIWGSTYVATRIVVRVAPPFESMGVRFLIAGVLVLGWAVAHGGWRRLRIQARDLWGLVAMALSLLAVNNGSVSIATRDGLPSGLAALLLAMVSVWIVVIRAVAGDRPAGLTLFGTVLGCAGTAAILLDGKGVAHWPLGGVAILLAASMCWALGLWMRPSMRLPQDAIVGNGYQLTLAGLLLFGAGMADREPLEFDYGAKTWIALAWLVVAVSIVGYTCYTYLIDTVPLSVVATHVYVNPVVAVVLGWALLSETLGMLVVLAGLAVVLSSALILLGERRLPASMPVTVD